MELNLKQPILIGLVDMVVDVQGKSVSEHGRMDADPFGKVVGKLTPQVTLP